MATESGISMAIFTEKMALLLSGLMAQERGISMAIFTEKMALLLSGLVEQKSGGLTTKN